MKRILLTLVLAVTVGGTFTSCTTDYFEEYIISTATYFAPPAWIEGRWAPESNDTVFKYDFTADDFIVNTNNVLQSYNRLINLSRVVDGDQLFLTEEVATSLQYKFTITAADGTIMTFDFLKIDENTFVDQSDPANPVTYVRF